MLIVTFAILGEGATSLSPSFSLTPPYAPVIKVVGKAYCYRCFNEAHPGESHGKKHLKGAMVKVTCQDNDQALVGFGYTKSNGKYSVSIKGLPLRSTYGADSCKVELHSAPGGSDCNVPIELNYSELSVYSKSNEEVVLQANQLLAFASQKKYGFCSKPQILPPMLPHDSPPSPYQFPSPPFNYKSPPLPYQFSPPTFNKLPPPSYQYPSPPQSFYPSPPPYQQYMPPNSYKAPPSYNYPPPPHGYKSPTPPTNMYLPPPYYFNSPPPQHQYSPAANSYVSPPLTHQYPPPPYKSPLVPSPPMSPYYYNSPPANQHSPPPYNYGSSPPTYQYSPLLPPNIPKPLPPRVPHEMSPPALSTSPQPLFHNRSLPPPQHADISSTAPSVNYQPPPPPSQLS
ncbi:hypothetical protein GUJ93_ZPchr0007g4136 [Zizania palustris]|uniref:Extensin domain-containing protein n=1 Tax=Zizania palustris TaxID=103762 RepID=A0A8J5TIZ7_ZIZPA|nr:hypothetical protein GUJ93_ZPchr0007g4136 [Zizania palustris]